MLLQIVTEEGVKHVTEKVPQQKNGGPQTYSVFTL